MKTQRRFKVGYSYYFKYDNSIRTVSAIDKVKDVVFFYPFIGCYKYVGEESGLYSFPLTNYQYDLKRGDIQLVSKPEKVGLSKWAELLLWGLLSVAGIALLSAYILSKNNMLTV